MRRLALIVGVLAGAAHAQVLYPPVDTSALDTVAARDSAIAAATPPICPTPASDTLTGTPGVAAACMARQDAARPTPVQAANTTLAADCTWSVTFSRAFTSSLPIIHASVALPAGSTQPIPCSPISRSSTTETGKCFPSQSTNLAAVNVAGISVAVGSQTINPTSSSCTAGMQVMVVGREPTQ